METADARETTVENAIEILLRLTDEEYQVFLSQSWRGENTP